VRRFFIENALYWLDEFHFDALRLDAVHEMYDHSARPFLQQLVRAVRDLSVRLGRPAYAIPESDLNDSRLVLPQEEGGFGFPAQWSDDLHHAVHCLLTGESAGYYADFGDLGNLVKAFRSGFVYAGEYSPARGRSHGNSPERIEGCQLVVFAQNHDQVGNRMKGDRLGHLTSFEAQKLAAGIVLLSPFLPLLFMGEEYGEDAPFLYFVSHSDPRLVDAVRRGRHMKFRAFGWEAEPPDPQAEETFQRSKLNRGLRFQGRHKLLYELYRELIRLRKGRPALALPSKKHMQVEDLREHNLIFWRRWNSPGEAAAAFHFGNVDARVELPVPAGRWTKDLHSGDVRWGGALNVPDTLESGGTAKVEIGPHAFVLFSREGGPGR
jgi:maltooligosyltrehalose trehalohydrolase